MKKSNKNNSRIYNLKGITLISCIITIIILLILSFAIITILINSNFLDKAKLASKKYQNENNEKIEILNKYENKIELTTTREESVTLTKNEYNSIIERLNKLENSNNGKIYYKEFSNVSAKADTTNIIANITLPAGKYVLIGYASYDGYDLRYHVDLGNAKSSAYDKDGYVRMNISDIVSNNNEETYNFYLFPSSKNVTVSGYIKAIKIGN